MQTTMQKKVWPRVACAVEIADGSSFSTVMPPSMPWPMTVPSAVQPSTFIHLRRLNPLRPDRQHDGQQADELGDHAVAVFELYSADHRRKAVERAERGRPVGNRKPGVVAGDQRAGNDQQKGGTGEKDGETVIGTVVRQWFATFRTASF